MENIIERNARILGISLEDAVKMAEDDKRIDRGENLFELTDEAKAAEKKMRQASRAKRDKPTAYDFKPRARKADEDKRNIILELAECLEAYNPEVTNPEREILFTFYGRKFKLTLSAPRT